MKFLVSLDNGKLYNVSLNAQRDDDNVEELNKPLVIKDVVLEENQSLKIIHMDLLNKDILYMIYANGDIIFYKYDVELQEDSTGEYINYNMLNIQKVEHKLHISLNDEHILESHKSNRKSKKPIQYNTAAISSEEMNEDVVLVNDIIKVDEQLILASKSGSISFICLKSFKVIFDIQVSAPLSFLKMVKFGDNECTLAIGGYENLLKIITVDMIEKKIKQEIATKPMKFNEKLNLPFPNWPIAATKMSVDTVEYYIEVTKFGFIKLYNLQNSKKPIGGLKDLLLARPFQKNMQPVITNVLIEDLESENKKKLILTNNVNAIWEITVSIKDNDLVVKQEGKISKKMSGYVTYLNLANKTNALPQDFQIIKKEEDEDQEEIEPLDEQEIAYLSSKSNFIKTAKLLTYAASNKITIVNNSTHDKTLVDWLLNSKINSVLVYDCNDVLSLKKYNKYVSRLIRKRGLTVAEEQNEEMWGNLDNEGTRALKKQKRVE